MLEHEDLSVLAKELHCAAAVNTRVFDFALSSTIGAAPITTASAINSARVWPPESSVISLTVPGWARR